MAIIATSMPNPPPPPGGAFSPTYRSVVQLELHLSHSEIFIISKTNAHSIGLSDAMHIHDSMVGPRRRPLAYRSPGGRIEVETETGSAMRIHSGGGKQGGGV